MRLEPRTPGERVKHFTTEPRRAPGTKLDKELDQVIVTKRRKDKLNLLVGDQSDCIMYIYRHSGFCLL